MEKNLNDNLFVYTLLLLHRIYQTQLSKKIASLYKALIINYLQSTIDLFNSPLLHNTQYFNKLKARYLANQNINCTIPFYRLEGLDDE